jgi:hypothetical protein
MSLGYHRPGTWWAFSCVGVDVSASLPVRESGGVVSGPHQLRSIRHSARCAGAKSGGSGIYEEASGMARSSAQPAYRPLFAHKR